jgi:hypothetical protein
LLIGLEQDEDTPVIDVRRCRFDGVKQIIKTENRWRIVHAYLSGTPMSEVGPESPTGPRVEGADAEEDETSDSEG